jgi:apolipoprotein N-acyltransferase
MMKTGRVDTAIKSDRWSYLWLAIAALLLVFTYGLYRNPLAAFLAPAFLLRFFRAQRIGRGYLLVFLALAVSSLISWWALIDDEFPIAIRIGYFGVIVGLLLSIPYLLDRVLVRRFQGFAATLIFPLANAGFDFLTMWPTPNTTDGSMAYSQFSSVYLTQLLSITGMWGVIFLVSWSASIINWVWEEGTAWQRIRRGVAVYAGVMLLVLLYGMIRLTVFQSDPGTARIHAVVGPERNYDTWSQEMTRLIQIDPAAAKASLEASNNRYFEGTVREARAGAQMVVWPELAALVHQEDLEVLMERARTIARQEGIYLAIGVGTISSDPTALTIEENKLIMFDPQGQVVIDYSKYGCILAFGMYKAQIQTVDTPFGRVGGVICCDLDFPYVVRQASQKGVDILLVPSWEPAPEFITAHSQMVAYRAIENGISIFRPTIAGLSLGIDPFGRTLGSMDATRTSERVFVVQLPNHHVFTIYSLVGDLFGWLMVIGFAGIVILAIVGERKRSSARPSR